MVRGDSRGGLATRVRLSIAAHHDEALAAPPPLRVLRVNGVELHYMEAGSGNQETVVLLHGGMGDLGSWTHQVRALEEQYRVASYSRRHSHPNRNRDIRRARFAEYVDDDLEDLLALKRELCAGPLHLIGTSYGALLALAVALRSPHEVVSLVLAEPPLHRWACASKAGRRLFSAFLEAWGSAGEAFEAGLQRRALQLLTDAMWGRPTFDRWPADRVDAAFRNAAALAALTRSQDPFPEIDRSAVAALTMPVLLVQGCHASKLHRCVMNELARVTPNARRTEIASAGHASPTDNPDEFNAAVVPFLGSLSCRAQTGKQVGNALERPRR